VKSYKQRYKLEAKEVLFGRREEVSRDLVEARMQGYKDKLRPTGQGANFLHGSRVREPPGGMHAEEKLSKEKYLKRQSAGGGIPVRSNKTHDRNWQLTVASLFF